MIITFLKLFFRRHHLETVITENQFQRQIHFGAITVYVRNRWKKKKLFFVKLLTLPTLPINVTRSWLMFSIIRPVYDLTNFPVNVFDSLLLRDFLISFFIDSIIKREKINWKLVYVCLHFNEVVELQRANSKKS